MCPRKDYESSGIACDLLKPGWRGVTAIAAPRLSVGRIAIRLSRGGNVETRKADYALLICPTRANAVHQGRIWSEAEGVAENASLACTCYVSISTPNINRFSIEYANLNFEKVFDFFDMLFVRF